MLDSNDESLTVLASFLPSAAAFNFASISAFFRAMMAACSDIWENLSWPGGLDDILEKTHLKTLLNSTKKKSSFCLSTFVYNPDRTTFRKLSLSKICLQTASRFSKGHFRNWQVQNIKSKCHVKELSCFLCEFIKWSMEK